MNPEANVATRRMAQLDPKTDNKAVESTTKTVEHTSYDTFSTYAGKAKQHIADNGLILAIVAVAILALVGVSRYT